MSSTSEHRPQYLCEDVRPRLPQDGLTQGQSDSQCSDHDDDLVDGQRRVESESLEVLGEQGDDLGVLPLLECGHLRCDPGLLGRGGEHLGRHGGPLRRLVVGGAAEHRDQLVAVAGPAEGLPQTVEVGSRVGLDDRRPQPLLAAEVLVDGASGVPGLGGDLLDRRPEETLAQEHLPPGAQQVFVRACCSTLVSLAITRPISNTVFLETSCHCTVGRMDLLLGVAAFLSLPLTLAGFTWYALRARRTGSGQSLMAPFEEIWDPVAHRTNVEVHAEA